MNNGRSWPRPKDVLDDLNSHRRDHGLGPMKYDYVNGVLSELRGKHGRRGTFGRSRTNDGTATAIAGGVGLGGALLAGTQNAEASDGSESDWDWGLPAAVGGGLAAVGGLYALTRGRGARRIGEVIPESEAIPDEVVPMSAVPDTGPSPARSVPDGGSAGAGRIPTRLSVEIEQPRGQTGSRYRLELDGQKNGFVTVTDDGDAWSVNNSYLDSDLRGQGHGVRMYEDLAERARQAGARTLRSDHSVSPDAQNAWMGLERRGYAVQRIDGPDGPRFEVDLTRSPSRGPDGGSAGASSAIDGPNGGPSGTTQALIGGAGLTGALALGASDAEADDILPLPDGLDFRQGSWEEPSWTPVELPDGTSAMSREMTGPDGRTYIIIAEQGADASINVLGYMNPASISDAGWGVAPPSTEPAQEEEAEEEDSLDLSDLRIPGAILAGVGARQGLRSLGVRAIPAEIGGSLTASGAAYAVDPDDPLGSIAIGALNPLAGRFADHLGGEVRRIGAAATRHLDELPEPVRGYEFDRDLRAPGIDDVIDTERAQEGREIQLRMAAESGEETRRRARALDPNAIPDGPPADFTERRGGREVSVFGEPAKPRERAPLPPLDERAAEQGAQGALRGVTPTKLREIADDLGIEAEGRGAADLRRTLVRELGRRFDSTKELIAFLGRYGVSAALVGVVANGEATAPSR